MTLQYQGIKGEDRVLGAASSEDDLRRVWTRVSRCWGRCRPLLDVPKRLIFFMKESLLIKTDIMILANFSGWFGVSVDTLLQRDERQIRRCESVERHFCILSHVQRQKISQWLLWVPLDVLDYYWLWVAMVDLAVSEWKGMLVSISIQRWRESKPVIRGRHLLQQAKRLRSWHWGEIRVRPRIGRSIFEPVLET